MAEPGPLDPSPQRVVTWRAILAGVLCVLFISLGAPFGTIKQRSSTMALDFSVPAAVFTMFVLALIVNLYRLLTRGRTLLSRGEMLVAYAMMAVACAICTMGLTAYLVPQVGTLHYYASPENQWRSVILPHTPSWLMLPTEGDGANAIKWMFQGLPKGLSNEQLLSVAKAWTGPLFYWGIFLLALYATSICLMAMFRKQWVEDERIVFPLVQLPMELAGEPSSPEHRVTPFLKNKLLWIGFAIPFIHCALRALPTFFPLMDALNPGDLVKDARMLNNNWRLQFRLSWQTLGLAYLISADVGLCVWLFGFLGSFYGGVSRFAGFKSPEKLGLYGSSQWPDMGHFCMGAMIALVFLRLWIGRKHLIGVVRKALNLETEVDDSREPMSYFWAFWIAVAGTIVMLAWLTCSGFPWYVAVVILFAAFVGFVGLTRIIAESGMPVSIVPLISSDFTVSALGTSVIGHKGLIALPWTYVWNGDVRTFVMCSAAHGMRGCSERRRTYRGVFLAMMLAVVLAIVASTAITLFFAYQSGGVNLAGWFFERGPKYPFEFARNWISELKAAETVGGKISDSLYPNLRGWITTGIGATAMVLFTIARHRFVWWPINPVGLPILGVHWTQYLWFSVFLAWLIKTRVLKYGGPKLYMTLRPLFLGLVLGQYAGAAFWIIVGGITSTPGLRVFWI